MKEMKPAYVSTYGEEVGNTVSHGIMFIITLLALPFSAVWAYRAGGDSILDAATVSVYVISVLLMFLSSTAYHSMYPQSKHKKVLNLLDHIFIYVAIAGTYTPIALSVIGGWKGILIVIVQWSIVIFGIFYKTLARKQSQSVSLAMYLGMGWVIVFFLPSFIRLASMPMLLLILAGCIFYTMGTFFYAKKGFRYHHLVWHIFVTLAVMCHYTGIVFFLH